MSQSICTRVYLNSTRSLSELHALEFHATPIGISLEIHWDSARRIWEFCAEPSQFHTLEFLSYFSGVSRGAHWRSKRNRLQSISSMDPIRVPRRRPKKAYKLVQPLPVRFEFLHVAKWSRESLKIASCWLTNACLTPLPPSSIPMTSFRAWWRHFPALRHRWLRV